MKKLPLKLVSFVLLFQLGEQASAQLINDAYLESYDAENNYFRFNQNIYESAPDVFKSDVFLMDEGFGFRILRGSDELGFSQYKYLQTYHDVSIEGTEFYVHVPTDGTPPTANGIFLQHLDVVTTASISPDDAITRSLDEMHAEQYAWQNEQYELNIKEEKGDESATWYPVPQLVIKNIAIPGEAPSYSLCYKVRVYALVPLNTVDYYVDAQTGNVVYQNSLILNCWKHGAEDQCLEKKSSPEPMSQPLPSCNAACQTGSANVKFYGSQYIYTDKFTYGIVCRYRTKNTCGGTFLYVRDPGGGDYRENGNSWGTDHQSGTTALFDIQIVYNYYLYNLGRTSFDNSGSQINIYTEDGNYQANAAWTGSDIHVGTQGSPFSDELLALDVLGHEFTHGVTQYEAGLTYYGESGALNESFSDIFGVLVDFYGKSNYAMGWGPDYLLADECISGGLRDMSNPNNKNQPDTYGGTYWASTSGPDNGGVHTNSGVQNYWFYLLAEGGSGTNDLGNPYCVKGIGRDKAAAIAYRNLTVYLSSGSNYSAARYYSIQSAVDLYGANSNEVAQTTAAWYAVGVGPNYSGTINVANHTATGTEVYQLNNKVSVFNFTANAGSNVTITSATEIEMLPSNMQALNGSLYSAYITPTCTGGAMAPYHAPEVVGVHDGETLTPEQVTLSIKEAEEAENYTVYPNPSDGMFKLSLDANSGLPKSIMVQDVMGNTVMTVASPQSTEYTFNLTGSANGLYLIKINYNEKTILKKLIKN